MRLIARIVFVLVFVALVLPLMALQLRRTQSA